jgi:phage gp16-like protein
MSIQQNINQLLFSAGYFAEPLMEGARAKTALKNLRTAQDIGEKWEEETGQSVPATVARDYSQAWYGMGKSEFARKPTEKNFANYVKTAKNAEEV